MSFRSENKIRKTLLTPCRRMGLKRKSLESTPNTSQDFSDSQTPTMTNIITSRSVSATHSGINTTPMRPLIKKLNTQLKKKIKVEQDEVDRVQSLEPIESDACQSQEENQGYDDLDSQFEKVEKRISEKKKEIEKLESDSKNVKQHNLFDLNSLICKWRRGCQAALKDLSHEYQNRDNNLTLPVLLNQLGIPLALVHYSESELDFQS